MAAKAFNSSLRWLPCWFHSIDHRLKRNITACWSWFSRLYWRHHLLLCIAICRYLMADILCCRASRKAFFKMTVWIRSLCWELYSVHLSVYSFSVFSFSAKLTGNGLGGFSSRFYPNSLPFYQFKAFLSLFFIMSRRSKISAHWALPMCYLIFRYRLFSYFTKTNTCFLLTEKWNPLQLLWSSI